MAWLKWIGIWVASLGLLPLHAQKLALGKGVEADGKLMGEATTFTLWTSGQSFVFGLHLPPDFEDEKLFILLDEKGAEGYFPLDNLQVVHEKNASFSTVSFSFSEPGVYRATVVTMDRKVLTSLDFEMLSPRYSQGPAHFEQASALFCSLTEKGVPMDTLFSISLVQFGALAPYFWVTNQGKSLDCTSLKLDLWCVEPGHARETWVRTEDLAIKPDWSFARIPVHFPGPGRYIARVFTPFDVFIAEATLLVNP